MRELLLNYQGFRGKFHILQVTCQPVGEECTVAKQIQSRIGYQWGKVTEIDRAQPFKAVNARSSEISGLFAAADAIELPCARKEQRGCDGTWYSLRIGDPATGRVISWWSDIEPQLQPVYDLRDSMVTMVMRSLRLTSPK